MPIYWVWVGTCVYANTHGLDTNGDRIGLLTIGLGGMFMALAVPGAHEEHTAAVVLSRCCPSRATWPCWPR